MIVLHTQLGLLSLCHAVTSESPAADSSRSRTDLRRLLFPNIYFLSEIASSFDHKKSIQERVFYQGSLLYVYLSDQLVIGNNFPVRATWVTVLLHLIDEKGMLLLK